MSLNTPPDEVLFSGTIRLYGEENFRKLQTAHIAVIGLGGVGSWAAEAIARSGVGRITLMDFDEICATNTNRQVHTLTTTVGDAKVTALASRLRLIHPNMKIIELVKRFDETTNDSFFLQNYDCVIDCTDRLQFKLLLIHACHARNIPVITIGGSGHRTDPGQIQVSDLNESHTDRLLFYVRKRLRERFDFPDRKTKTGVIGIFSTEAPNLEATSTTEQTDTKTTGTHGLDCQTGLGSSVVVTGSFGFRAAAEAIRTILARPRSGL